MVRQLPDRCSPAGKQLRALLVALILACTALLAGRAQAAEAGVQTTWRLLDYIAVDYAGAVSGGRIVNQFEYDEMLEFSASVRTRIAALPPTPARIRLEQSAGKLRQSIEAKAPPQDVARLSRALASDLLTAHPVPLAPAEAPDMGRAGALYASSCASCHGPAGEGGRGEFAKLDPPPIAFADRERARERSIFGLYQVITQGLEGTAMQSFAALPEEERWALAFHSGRFAFPEVEKGKRIWNEDESVRRRIPDMAALAAVTPAELASQIGEEKAFAVIAYLRANPAAVAADAPRSRSLRIARDNLAKSIEAYAAGDRRAAGEFALAAYLDGFEPVEAVLAARDGDLMGRVEAAMGEFRAAIASGRPEAELRGRAAAIESLLKDAETALSPEAETDLSTFLGAFTILLREGLEALLVVIAMIAFLRKAERPEVLPYVHGGWVAALIAGAATWVVATTLVGISGASRELTEGFGALLAAVVLVSVGIWMHGKSQADEWRRYIQEKLGRALSRGSAWFLFGLAFIVVYREVFETILFYAALWTPDNGRTILAGALSAVALLAVIAWAMLRYSRKLPITQFFALSSILIAILAVVLAGKGIGALQEAGLVPLTLIPGAPRISWLGIFPTAEALGAQLLTLLVLVYGFRANRRGSRSSRAAPAAAE
jgi:high-affinity iron transporter